MDYVLVYELIHLHEPHHTPEFWRRVERAMPDYAQRKDELSRVGAKTFEVTEFLARLLQHVPEPRLHQIRYYGYYSNVARARRAAGEVVDEVAVDPDVPEPGAAERRRLRRSWAQLIRRIYEVDPLTCTECGGRMRIIAFLMDPAVVRKILDHLAARPGRSRGPPACRRALTATSR